MVLALVVAVAAVMLVLWLRRRRGAAAAQAWGEAACPACLGLSLVPGLGVLTAPTEGALDVPNGG